MKCSKQKSLRTIGLFVLAQCFVEHSFAQGNFDLKAICKDNSGNSQAMAMAAGYDFDKLCSNLSAFSAKNSTVQQPRNTEVIPRISVSSKAAVKYSEIIAPVAVSGVEVPPPTIKLKPFGYDLFAGEPSDFEQAARIPVSPDYLLGPGDRVEVGFYGKLNDTFSLEISRDGSIDFPSLGPINLAGMTFSDAKQLLQQRIKREMIGVELAKSRHDVAVKALEALEGDAERAARLHCPVRLVCGDVCDDHYRGATHAFANSLLFSPELKLSLCAELNRCEAMRMVVATTTMPLGDSRWTLRPERLKLSVSWDTTPTWEGFVYVRECV
jgi:hypothetical protein